LDAQVIWSASFAYLCLVWFLAGWVDTSFASPMVLSGLHEGRHFDIHILHRVLEFLHILELFCRKSNAHSPEMSLGNSNDD
jgi:hypothetical protein